DLAQAFVIDGSVIYGRRGLEIGRVELERECCYVRNGLTGSHGFVVPGLADFEYRRLHEDDRGIEQHEILADRVSRDPDHRAFRAAITECRKPPAVRRCRELRCILVLENLATHKDQSCARADLAGSI